MFAIVTCIILCLVFYFSLVHIIPVYHHPSIRLQYNIDCEIFQATSTFLICSGGGQSLQFTVSKFRVTRFTRCVVSSEFLYWNREFDISLSLLFVHVVLLGFCLVFLNRNVLCIRFTLKISVLSRLNLPKSLCKCSFSSLNSENLIQLYCVLSLPGIYTLYIYIYYIRCQAYSHIIWISTTFIFILSIVLKSFYFIKCVLNIKIEHDNGLLN